MFCLVYFCLVLNKTTAVTSRVYPLPNNVCSTARLAARPHALRPCARQPRGCHCNWLWAFECSARDSYFETLNTTRTELSKLKPTGPWARIEVERERVLFIGTRFSNLYTAVDTPAGAARCCAWCVCVFVCKCVLGSPRASQPLNIRLCLF